ncbi:MAG: DNA translocase FtsK [Paludibacteraceae bacterium]|nr:DNA translocase FtsK [Paludibacteraceae bacterium]
MHPIGVTILLVVTLLIFLMLADRHFWEHMGAWWERVKAIHLPKHPKTDPDTPAPTDEPTTVDINVTDITEPAPADIEPSDDPLSGLTIEQTPTEQVVTNTPQDQPEDTEKTPNLDIEETKEVELKEDDPEYRLKKLGPYDPRKDLSTYKFPSLSLLKVYDNETAPIINEQEQQDNARRIVQALRNFDVEIEKIKATVGPTVTLYEIVPKAGTRIAKIQNLENDIMLSLSAIGIRIIAPMPGKGTIGIEVPNEKPQVVSMHSVIASGRFQDEQKMRLPIAIGRTITNEVFCFDLAKTPHLLVAGATGQGKSVGLNAIITSLLYKKHPAELKFVLVDPKMVEFSIYKPLLKHYMAAMPDQEERDIIITDCQKVINTLNSLVIEMEDRYTLLADANCRNLEDYNEKFCIRRLNPEKPVENVLTKKILHHHFMPYLVIIIDEYGDFIMQAGKEVERPIQRLAQKARAVGMHMILATQRPDVKIVTGTIKANIPTRIAFRTQSVVDSRTVLDAKGADQLIGKGDMLYSGGGNLTRIQCAFVDTPEVEAIVQHVHGQQGYLEPYQLPEYVPEGQDDAPVPGSVDTRHLDPMFADVARYVVSKQEGSTSRLQRAFEIGYNRAGKLSDQLEAMGIVGPNKGPKGRDVLIQDLDSLERLLASLNE